jgi:hypothetical protein
MLIIYATVFSYHGLTAPTSGQGLLIVEDSNYTQTKRILLDFSGQVTGPTQRPLSDNTTLTRHRRPRRRQDSNPQSHQANGRRSTPQTARTLGYAKVKQSLWRPGRLGVLSLSEFPHNQHMKVTRLSALSSGRLYSQEIFQIVNSVRGWDDPKVIGNGTRNLLARNAVLQPTAPRRTTIFVTWRK